MLPRTRKVVDMGYSSDTYHAWGIVLGGINKESFNRGPYWDTTLVGYDEEDGFDLKIELLIEEEYPALSVELSGDGRVDVIANLVARDSVSIASSDFVKSDISDDAQEQMADFCERFQIEKEPDWFTYEVIA